MATKKTLNNSLLTVNALVNANSNKQFFLYINWINKFISIHRSDSSDLVKKKLPEEKGSTFSETRNGIWQGPYSSYLEAVGFAKLISDIHHLQCNEYLLVCNSGGVVLSPLKPF
ncbi:MAG: hypothetical protein HQK91_08535 [Nitrospirae bacterium]|nr:hypothetical protein [Nitrospirota bacterium]MBF0541479.1 hypothetical protein [Nitrospirota bacterium]